MVLAIAVLRIFWFRPPRPFMASWGAVAAAPAALEGQGGDGGADEDRLADAFDSARASGQLVPKPRRGRPDARLQEVLRAAAAPPAHAVVPAPPVVPAHDVVPALAVVLAPPARMRIGQAITAYTRRSLFVQNEVCTGLVNAYRYSCANTDVRDSDVQAISNTFASPHGNQSWRELETSLGAPRQTLK
eukprot:5862368-Pyramimonas_sp.AAC.1